MMERVEGVYKSGEREEQVSAAYTSSSAHSGILDCDQNGTGRARLCVHGRLSVVLPIHTHSPSTRLTIRLAAQSPPPAFRRLCLIHRYGCPPSRGWREWSNRVRARALRNHGRLLVGLPEEEGLPYDRRTGYCCVYLPSTPAPPFHWLRYSNPPSLHYPQPASPPNDDVSRTHR
jgi:hypothetical protein